MRKLGSLLALFAVFAASAIADLSHFVAQGPDVFGGYTSDYILVRFKSGQVPAGLHPGRARTGSDAGDGLAARWRVSKIDVLQSGGYGDAKLAERLGLSRTYLIRVPHGTEVRQMAEEYRSLSSVELAEVDGIGGVAYTPNDPNIGLCWGLNNTGQTGGTPMADIRAFLCWDIWKGSDNITLAVVDTGVDTTHPELVGRSVAGRNTHDNNNNTTDGFGHGTHVSGTALASGDNGIGLAGVSLGATLMPVRVLDSGGSGTEAQCGAGIVWAADHGANICSMSLQYYTGSQVFHDNVDYAFGRGVLLIAANGNNQGNIIAFPARFSNCYGIGATTSSDTIAGFSNYGPQCDVSAPGQDVYSLWLNHGYNTISGTSMATPHTSGLASLIWSYDRGLINTEVFEIIRSTADDKGAPGYDQFFGWGRINAYSAILKAREPLAGFTTFSVPYGALLSGTATDLFSSDHLTVQIQSRRQPSASAPDAQLVAEGTAPELPFVRLQFLVESSVTTTGVVQVVEAYDFVAGAWVVIDIRPATTTDAFTVVNLSSDPARFVQTGTNKVRARVSFLDRGAPVAAWNVKLDQFRAALRNTP